MRAFQKVAASTLRPRGSSCKRGLRFVPRRGRLNAFVENHGDVRPERDLDLRGLLRSEEMLRAVEMRTEAHAFIGYFSQFGKTEDLVAAGISENGTRPGHELVEASELAHEFVA